MTAKYISDKCGQVTIGVQNNQFPLMPLFSPVYSSTRPYSQTRSNTQRALMLPDEVLRMDNRQCLVLLRGQQPMLLHKIIPDEFEAFQKLRHTPVSEYIPTWRTTNQSKAKKTQGTTNHVPPVEHPLQDEIQIPNPPPEKPEAQYEYNFPDDNDIGIVEASIATVLGDKEEE